MNPDHKLSVNLRALAKAIDDVLEKESGNRVGFILLLTPMSSDKSQEVHYVSNLDRGDALSMLNTLTERWEQDAPDVPFHEKN